MSKKDTGNAQAAALSKRRENREAKKVKFLEAYKTNNFNVASACASAGVSPVTFSVWKKDDAFFREEYVHAKESRVRHVENKLMELINGVTTQKFVKGEPVIYLEPPCKTSIIFFLKTQGKHKGYVERQEIQGFVEQPLLGDIEKIDQEE